MALTYLNQRWVVLVLFLLSVTVSCQIFQSEELPGISLNHQSRFSKSLNILLVGNSITYSNNLTSNLKSQFDSLGIQANVDTFYSPGSNLNSLMNKMMLCYCLLNPAQCNEIIYKSNTIQCDSNCYINIFGYYDIIYLQSEGIENPYIYNIIQNVYNSKKDSAKILLFENYSDISWSDSIRGLELSNNLSVFKKYTKSMDIELVPVGSEFNKLLNSNHDIRLTDNSNHPSPVGSNIMCKLIFNSIVAAISKM